MNEFKNFLDFLNKNDLYPDIRTIIGSSTEPVININGKKIIIFCSTNYLGLSSNRKVKDEVKKATEI